jgi:hypothetical protein
MKTTDGQAAVRRSIGLRLAVILATMGVTAVLATGPAFSSGNEGAESYEHHGEESHEHHGSGRVESKLYGTVQKIPAKGIGIWTVSGREIQVTRETHIKEEYGKAATGAYVEVEGGNTGKIFTANKIEVKRAKK